MSHYHNNPYHTNRTGGNDWNHHRDAASSTTTMNPYASNPVNETRHEASHHQPPSSNHNQSNNATQVNDLKEQLQAVRQELNAQSEANFELNATIATMQAEMDHAIKNHKEQASQEASKLKHLLRLEQQKSQRLEQQRQQQQQNHQHQVVQPPQRKGFNTESVFSKRLAVAAATTSRAPAAATVSGGSTNNSPALAIGAAASLSPKSAPITPAATPRNQNSNSRYNQGASRLARHLLQEVSVFQNANVRQVLTDISSDDHLWTEVKLIEFLIRHASSELWYPALLQSRPGRQNLVQAIEQENRSIALHEKKGPSSRITLIGRSAVDVDYQSLSIAQALQNPWWTQGASTAASNSMPSALVRGWLSNLVNPDNSYTTMKQNLQALNILMEECVDDNSNHVWWEICLGPMEKILERIYQQWMQRASSSQPRIVQSKGSHTSNNPMTHPRKRRIAVLSVEAQAQKESTDQSPPKELLALSLSILVHLLQTVEKEQLERWNKEGNSLRLVSLVLDLLEEENGETVATTIDQNSRKRISIDGWYLDAIQFLMAVGKTRVGFDILRTRTRPADAGGDNSIWMGNALHVGIRQLFSLVMDQEEETSDSIEGRRRVIAIEGWIRLWHQILQTCDAKELTFRSLVLDHQNWYTSACAMLLANGQTRSDIKSMIQGQLEELSMDEEEHEELKE